MTSSAKRQVSVTLDADLVAALETRSGTTLSAEVNSALRAEFTRRQRQQALADLLDRLADERGRLMRLVLDAEAVNALLDPRHPAERKVRRAMEAARRLRREVAIATGTLAELYRGAAGASSALFADAHPVAVAVEAGGGVVQTADPGDLSRLAAPYRTVVIESLAQGKGPPS